MLEECINGLNIKKDGVYIDGTLGGAGHSIEILKRLSEKGRLIGIDRDLDALEAAKKRLESFSNVTFAPFLLCNPPTITQLEIPK